MSDETKVDSMSEVKKTMTAIEGIVRILGPLESGERQRIIQGAMIVLGETLVSSKMEDGERQGDEQSPDGAASARARAWMRQHNISDGHLSHVFDIAEGVATVIASELPGKSTAERVIKAYALTGIGNLVSSGEANFDDKQARAVCEMLSCYDRTNHSKYLKEKGNNFIGDKGTGWKLTAPGLRFGAAVVKELAGTGHA